MPRIGRTGKVAAVAVAGVAALGGLSAAGALPNVSELSGGHSAVETVPPDQRPRLVLSTRTLAAASRLLTWKPPSAWKPRMLTRPTSTPPTLRQPVRVLDGLETAAGNVTNDTASAVITTLIGTEPVRVSVLRSATLRATVTRNVPTDVPPAQASNAVCRTSRNGEQRCRGCNRHAAARRVYLRLVPQQRRSAKPSGSSRARGCGAQDRLTGENVAPQIIPGAMSEHVSRATPRDTVVPRGRLPVNERRGLGRVFSHAGAPRTRGLLRHQPSSRGGGAASLPAAPSCVAVRP